MLSMELITILISVLALGLGIINLCRSIKATPRPKLDAYAVLDGTSREMVDDQGRPCIDVGIEVNITNRGNGMAHDVQVEVPSQDGESWLSKLDGIEPNTKSSHSFGVDRDELFHGLALKLWWTEYPSGRRQSVPLELHVDAPR